MKKIILGALGSILFCQAVIAGEFSGGTSGSEVWGGWNRPLDSEFILDALVDETITKETIGVHFFSRQDRLNPLTDVCVRDDMIEYVDLHSRPGWQVPIVTESEQCTQFSARVDGERKFYDTLKQAEGRRGDRSVRCEREEMVEFRRDTSARIAFYDQPNSRRANGRGAYLGWGIVKIPECHKYNNAEFLEFMSRVDVQLRR